MNDDDDINKWIDELRRKYGDRRRSEYQNEKAPVARYLQELRLALGETYRIEKALAVGGTGVVFLGRHNRFSQRVVIKFNRPNLPAGERTMVENEASVLPGLNHPNIIRVLDLGERSVENLPKLTYLIEPFISGSMPLFTFEEGRADETWLRKRISQLHGSIPESADDPGQTVEYVNGLLLDVAVLFVQWVSLLAHLHAEGYAYLDVKPENMLVDEHGHATAIDFGSVERLDPADASPVEVFFTERYAHPNLIKRKREKASSNRVRGAMKRSDIRVGFDYYALGASLLETLNEVGNIRDHLVPQLPLYRSLHFLATRLLDGSNSARPKDNSYSLAPQVFPALTERDYDSLRYVDLADVERDLEKERGRWNLEDQVPELASYSKDIVRLVPGFNTVLTARLRGIIEHPLVARLKCITQLGLVSLVYPTADHARYDHSLGTYTYTTNYIKSLFNDLGNPVFRNLVGVDDLKAVLLASLLHDLGQYPLAHDLEEVHDRIFKHSQIGMLLLNDPAVDRHGRTLREIIEDPKHGWGVPLSALSQIVGAAHSPTTELFADADRRALKTDVLAAVIDGPVDADKADYITRDSSRCELPYGSQLDIERLLRVLTVAIIPEEAAPRKRVTLGVYDKGIASAHAFGQARYQLLATVYWHHTSRIAKAMLQYAATIGLPQRVFGPQTPDQDRLVLEIREQLLDFVKSLAPPFNVPRHQSGRAEAGTRIALDLSGKPPEEVPELLPKAKRGGTGDKAGDLLGWYPGVAWTDWLMLRWVSELPAATDESRQLILGIQTRRLYKRIATFARNGRYDDLIRSLEDMDWPARVGLCRRLHERVRDRLNREWSNPPTATFMSLTEFDILAASNLLVLIDVPRPSKKIGYDRPLGVVPELKERTYHQDVRQATEDKRWRRTMEEMTNVIAPVRVLCHPDVRNLVSAVYAPTETTLAEEIEGLLGSTG